MGLENEVFNKTADQQLNGEVNADGTAQYSDSTLEEDSPMSQRLETVPGVCLISFRRYCQALAFL